MLVSPSLVFVFLAKPLSRAYFISSSLSALLPFASISNSSANNAAGGRRVELVNTGQQRACSAQGHVAITVARALILAYQPKPCVWSETMRAEDMSAKTNGTVCTSTQSICQKRACPSVLTSVHIASWYKEQSWAPRPGSCRSASPRHHASHSMFGLDRLMPKQIKHHVRDLIGE